MTRTLRSLGLRVLFTLASAVIVTVLLIGAVHSMQDRDEVAKMTSAVKTVCVGRFLIDMPKDAQVTLSLGAVDGFNISTDAVETEREFMARVAQREAELNGEKNQFGKKSLESAQEIKEDGQIGKIFVFGRYTTYGYEGEKKVSYTIVSVNGYVRAGGVSFNFIADAYDPAQVGNLRKVIRQLRPRANDEIPSEPGFCINQGLIREPLNADQLERVVMFAGLPGHPDLSIVFSTMAGTKSGPGLLARNAAATEQLPALLRALIGSVRKGARTINSLPGEEVMMKVRELNFATTYGFNWEMSGTENDVLAPFLTLELQSGINPRSGGKPLQSTLSEAALVDLWDKISSSIRLRPTSKPKPVETGPVVPPLGTGAVAGERCPQSGWWRCSEGGSGVGVLGGQRQFIKQGQRMPQALLLPPQTLWQKLRGLQPSYETERPTSWTLQDKRSRVRTVSPLPLAQAQLVAASTAIAAGADTEPAVRVGSFVRTGTPCPASGWWRCEESHALDGTRWFARGSVLPAATFQVPRSAFGRSQLPETIQRRSNWQLVRHARVPEAGQGAGDLDGTLASS